MWGAGAENAGIDAVWSPLSFGEVSAPGGPSATPEGRPEVGTLKFPTLTEKA